VLVETLETATFWSRLPDLYARVSTALTEALADDSPLVLCHVSHVYPTGASLYFTVAAKQREDGLAQWGRAKRAASDAIVAAGATITHHHAVGRDHLPWLAAEIGPVGVEMLRAVKARLDPVGVLNPGALVP
jgi:alkyldihydroxyacetonephosphate synthase